MKLILTGLLALLAVSSVIGEQKSYSGYKVLRTATLSASQALALRKLEDDFDFWKEARPSGNADIMVKGGGQDFEKLEAVLNDLNLKYSVMVEDVQELIDETSKNSRIHERRSDAQLDWEDYYDHQTINSWMDDLAKMYDFVDTVSIGKSYEGRDMRVIRISKAGPTAPTIWIEAGIHAREWISLTVATFVINELLTNPAHSYLDRLNFHILPAANPDGYEYSIHGQRLWRKTRSDTGSSLGCKGVDGNRNWSFHFGESGVSTNKCSDIYMGEEAFSEPETSNIRDYVSNIHPKPISANCFHSYSQLFLYPYGYAHEYPENVREIRDLAVDATEALYSVHGTVFEYMSAADLYPAAGASDDWYKGELGVRFVYTMELRDKGRYGFLLPTSQIRPSGEEMWAAMATIFDKMIQLS